MAVPTFSSVTPAVGPAGGRIAVTIAGTNFATPPAPPASGPVGDLGTPVAVEIDGVRCETVEIVSATALRVLLPPFSRTDDTILADPLPAAAIRIINLDSNGDPILGEEVTATGAFQYQRSALHQPDATEELQVYRRTIREVVQVFQRQLVANTAIGTNVDFGDLGQMVIKAAKHPSCTLIGPRIVEDTTNRHHWIDFSEEDLGGDLAAQYWPDFVASLEFDVVLASNKRRELYALVQGFIELFQRTPWIRIPRAPGDVNGDFLEFPLMMMSAPAVDIEDPNSNLNTATASFEVQYVPFHYDEAVTITDTVDDYPDPDAYQLP